MPEVYCSTLTRFVQAWPTIKEGWLVTHGLGERIQEGIFCSVCCQVTGIIIGNTQSKCNSLGGVLQIENKNTLLNKRGVYIDIDVQMSHYTFGLL